MDFYSDGAWRTGAILLSRVYFRRLDLDNGHVEGSGRNDSVSASSNMIDGI